MKLKKFMQKQLFIILAISTMVISLNNCSPKPDKHLLVNKIKHIAQLATVEFRLRKIIIANKEKKFLLFGLGTATFVSWVEPLIKAGIDLEQISIEDLEIDENNKLIKIKLPPINIIQYDFNEEEINVDYNLTADKVFNRFDLEDMEVIYRNADKDIRTYLNFIGLREEAERSTRLFFSKFFKSMGYESDVTFNNSTEPLLFYDFNQTTSEESN